MTDKDTIEQIIIGLIIIVAMILYILKPQISDFLNKIRIMFKKTEGEPHIKIGVSLMVGGFAIGTIGGIFINDVIGWIGLGALISGIVITYFNNYFGS